MGLATHLVVDQDLALALLDETSEEPSEGVDDATTGGWNIC